MRIPAHIRGVLFDLDGTIYAMPRLLKLRVALDLMGDLHILRHVGGAREWIREREFEDGPSLERAYFEELGRRAGLDPARAARWFEYRFLHAIMRQMERRCTPRPGLVAGIRTLRDRSLPVGVLSDYEKVAERLQALRIPVTLFDELMGAGEAGALKPSPRPFLMAAQRLGVDPERLLVVGDRDDMDGAGARAAGMPFLHVDRLDLDASMP